MEALDLEINGSLKLRKFQKKSGLRKFLSCQNLEKFMRGLDLENFSTEFRLSHN